MSRKKSCLCAMSMFIFVGFSPVVAEADSIDVSTMDATALRALFQSPPFNAVCPLVVYDEDQLITAMQRRATVALRHTDANTPRKSAALVIHEMLRSPEFSASDGLVDYGDTYTSAELSYPRGTSQ